MIKGKEEVTIHDMASALKISIATVSRVLKEDPVVNIKIKKKIFVLAEKIDYRLNHLKSRINY